MKSKLLVFLAAGSLCFTACDKILDTEPKQAISAEGALNSITGVKGLLVNVYDNMQATGYYGRDLIVQSEVLSDNARITVSNSNRFVNESNNVVRAHFDDFDISYQMINKLNLVVDHVDATTDGSTTEKAQIKGEALFLRGLLYFNLVNEYGYNPKHIRNGFDAGVPLMLKGVSGASQVTYPERAKVTEVYAQIKKDVLDAAGLLTNTRSKSVASKAAAEALLSRIALYNGDWNETVRYATDAINSGFATFVNTPTAASYASIFTQKVSPESLFELNYEINESLSSNSIQSIFMEVSGSGYGDVVPQNNFMATFEDGDLRKDVILKPIVKAGEPVFQVQKYGGYSGGYGADNIRILRMSEMYLNRAEAYARLGNDDLAQEDVNRLRVRAGLPETTATGDALLEIILKERRIELAFEGHRWFDLMRTGSDVVKENSTSSFTLPFSDYRVLAPIPQAQLDINKQLVQNPGY